jgi:hypothetical protein
MSSAKLMPSESFAPTTAKRMAPCTQREVNSRFSTREKRRSRTHTLITRVGGRVFSQRHVDIGARLGLPKGLRRGEERGSQRTCRRKGTARTSAHLLLLLQPLNHARSLPSRLNLIEKVVTRHKDDDSLRDDLRDIDDGLSELVRLFPQGRVSSAGARG